MRHRTLVDKYSEVHQKDYFSRFFVLINRGEVTLFVNVFIFFSNFFTECIFFLEIAPFKPTVTVFGHWGATINLRGNILSIFCYHPCSGKLINTLSSYAAA